MAAILVALLLAVISNQAGKHEMNRVLGIGVLVLITAALFWSLGTLIAGLPGKKQPPMRIAALGRGVMGKQRAGVCVLVLAAGCRRPACPR